MRKSMTLLCLLLLAGCATPLEVGSITEIKPAGGVQGLDVYAARRTAGEPVPEFAGDQVLDVRTYAYLENSGEVEIAGATCEVTARDFTATVQTPAKVRVPLYREKTSALSVSCAKVGFQKRLVVAEVFDVTRAQRMGAGGSGGLIGVTAALIVDGMSDNSKNDWRYRPARVVLLPANAAPTQ